LKIKYLKLLRDKTLTFVERKQIAHDVLDLCKKIKDCVYCEAIQGQIKKIGATKLEHLVYQSKSKNTPDLIEVFEQKFEEAISINPDIRPYLNKTTDDLNPFRVRELFKKIVDEGIKIFKKNVRH
jgi:DNA-directed RNA polymerase III subunit RPC1